MDRGGEQFERLAAYRRRGQELARRLADNADEIAVTLDRMADFHERVAREASHPLREQAAQGAAAERRMAERERSAARRYRRTVAGESVADEAVAGEAGEEGGEAADQPAG
jgi:hypothetical protein